jgi:hypothetical protein
MVVGLPLPPISPYLFTLTHTERDFLSNEKESIVKYGKLVEIRIY